MWIDYRLGLAVGLNSIVVYIMFQSHYAIPSNIALNLSTLLYYVAYTRILLKLTS